MDRVMNTGIIPTMYRRIVCTLWRGHNYVRKTKFIDGPVIWKCTYCQKEVNQ